MKTLEERIRRIEDRLGIKDDPRFRWTVSINDGYTTLRYQIAENHGNIAIPEVAKNIASLLRGVLTRID